MIAEIKYKNKPSEKEKIKSLVGKAIIEMVKRILKRTNALNKRLQGSALEGLKLSDLSDFEIMGLPEASVIAIVDWYYCNKINGLDEEENFKKIIMIRKIFPDKEEIIKKLNRVLVKRPQSLAEFIKTVIEAEHGILLSLQNIEQLISEYKKIRKIE